MSRRYQFEKPFLDYQAQLDRLKQRGLIVDDNSAAIAYLARVNYSRLRPYWYPFEDSGYSDHRFVAGTRFEDIVHLYEFDRELRLHVFAAVERIEVALRTRWAYHLSKELGPFGYLDCSFYRDLSRFAGSVRTLKNSGIVRKTTTRYLITLKKTTQSLYHRLGLPASL